MKVLCSAQMGMSTAMGQTMRVVAIAKALQRRGHDIRFIAAGNLIPIIKNFGIDVVEVSNMPDIELFIDSQKTTNLPKPERLAGMQELMAKIMQMEVDVAKKEKPHLLLSGTISGPSAAQKVGIPSIITFLQPHGAKTLNMFNERIPQHDESANGLLPEGLLTMIGAADIVIMEGMPEISGGIESDNFGQASFKLAPKIRFTGPLLVKYPDQMPERNELKKIHINTDGKYLAYITIGGGTALIGEKFLSLILDSLRIIPEITGIISTGIAISPEMIETYNPPGNAIVRGFVPGTEMIKASDVTIFHGGSSTLMNCIACGTPAVVVPSIGEQEDNGNVLAQFGAGIVLDKQTLTPAIMAEAMQKIISDSQYRSGAQRLKILGEKYGGASAAADWAEELVGGKSQ